MTNKNQTTIQSIIEQFGEIKQIAIDNHIIADKDDNKDLFQLAMNLANKKSKSGDIKAFAFSRINGIVKLRVTFFAPTSFPKKAVAV